jgi:hypothetical protein
VLGGAKDERFARAVLAVLVVVKLRGLSADVFICFRGLLLMSEPYDPRTSTLVRFGARKFVVEVGGGTSVGSEMTGRGNQPCRLSDVRSGGIGSAVSSIEPVASISGCAGTR